MKTIYLAVLCCLIHSITFAQEVQGTISNTQNETIASAHIRVLHSEKETFSDDKGNYILSLAPGTYTLDINAFGYLSEQKTIVLKKENQILNIQLEENNTNLEEVVISASREKQLRKEVPAAIGVINSEIIQETKPFGLDQIINQVPGVYMSTSRVASNEQHFMAARSPISTKGLFLYLEDGLPIRPTAVFNHNALLEMNDLSYDRMEVIKGPASSIYGSESVGGSFNFITKTPSPEMDASIGFQWNDVGLQRYELEVSNQISENLGLYFGTHYVMRKDGPIAHSDYEKFAATLKTVYDFNDKVQWTSVWDVIDYRSDMAGSLSENDYSNGNYESDQTFTEREALAFRLRNTVTSQWNAKNKTSFNLVYRDNTMDQNPSYRIRQFRNNGQLTGFGSGEVNSNQFNSILGLIQHKKKFSDKNASIIVGASIDFSPQEYLANSTNVNVNTETGQNIDFTINAQDYILNYHADILNYAGYLQYEINPIDALKITAGLRYDRFEYDYNSAIDSNDSKDQYENWTPKIGVNYNFSNTFGSYINYSQGFMPPQVATLYRNRNEIRDLKPSTYDNYEIGTYFQIDQKISVDMAVYLLDGKNTLITLRDDEDNFYNTNAGKTRSYGVEYGIKYTPFDKLSLRHTGSFAKHRYVSFFENDIDYSDTDRETAPSLLGTTILNYKPIENVSISAEHELVGDYNTSFENQVSNDDGTSSTASYDGHSIFNLRASYQYKKVELWAHALNIFDELYATRASYNRFRSENSYTIGNPFTFHLGMRIHL